MSGTGGRCEYVLDPDTFETWESSELDEGVIDSELLDEEGNWHCPHECVEGKKLCIFHLPVDEKNDDMVVESFIQVLHKEAADSANQPKSAEFLNAKFGRFNIHNDIELPDLEIWLTYSEFKSHVNIQDMIFDCQFVDVSKSEFGEEVKIESTSYNAHVSFYQSIFHSEALFSDVDFEEGVSFFQTKFKSNANFYRSNFIGNVLFNESIFSAEAYFGAATFDGVQIEFNQAMFYGDADFELVTFNGRPEFNSVEFNGKFNFIDAPIKEGNFSKSDLTGGVFTDANLQKVNLEESLLSRATFFGADLRGARLSGAILSDARIDEGTQFLGHPSNDNDSSPHTFSAIRSQPTCVYDPDYEEQNEHEHKDKAKSVYRALEELGGKHARPRLQARSFVRRQDLQKQDYWDDATADDASLEERLIAGARWSRAKVARATLLYGESPWRVIAWSLGIIFSFALLYPLGGWMKPANGDPITYVQIASNPVEILNSVYYSTLTYTALGFGDFQPVGLGRLLTTLETGLGAVMLALLVFILGRRAAR